jgi:plasmid maintenance system antidote protein VapI
MNHPLTACAHPSRRSPSRRLLDSAAFERQCLSDCVGAAKRIHKIVKARRGVSAVTAARLAKYFGGDAASWLVLQANYDLKTLPTQGEIERMVNARERLAVRARVEAAMNTPNDID